MWKFSKRLICLLVALLLVSNVLVQPTLADSDISRSSPEIFMDAGDTETVSQETDDIPSKGTVIFTEWPDSIEVSYGTDITDIDFPSVMTAVRTVEDSSEDGEEVEVPVIWECLDYDAQTPGTYLFEGSVESDSSYVTEEKPQIEIIVLDADEEDETVTDFLDENTEVEPVSESVIAAANGIMPASLGAVTINLSDTALSSQTGYTVAGDVITLTGDYDYTLTGITTTYQVIVEPVVEKVILENVRITSETPFKVGNGADLILIVSGTNILTARNNLNPAIHVAGSDLTIIGKVGRTDTLSVTGSAGIGSAQGEDMSGTIYIENVTATAKAYNDGAGIGSSSGGAMNGNIIIRDSEINSWGETGIGSGAFLLIDGPLDDYRAGDMSGTIRIENNACVTADGGGGAGIGSGSGSNLSGEILINNAEVIAYGYTGAAIGNGAYGHFWVNGSQNIERILGEMTTGTITIENNAVVTATSTNTGISGGTGIGTGYNTSMSKYASIIIKDSDVKATGAGSSAGIGSAYRGSMNGEIIIESGTIIASGGPNGAGIGTGSGYGTGIGTYNSAFYATGHVQILGGDITATGGSGTGDGIGRSANASSMSLRVTLNKEASLKAYANTIATSNNPYTAVFAGTISGDAQYINAWFTDNTAGPVDLTVRTNGYPDIDLTLPSGYFSFGYILPGAGETDVTNTYVTANINNQSIDVVNGHRSYPGQIAGPYDADYNSLGITTKNGQEQVGDSWPVMLAIWQELSVNHVDESFSQLESSELFDILWGTQSDPSKYIHSNLSAYSVAGYYLGSDRTTRYPITDKLTIDDDKEITIVYHTASVTYDINVSYYYFDENGDEVEWPGTAYSDTVDENDPFTIDTSTSKIPDTYAPWYYTMNGDDTVKYYFEEDGSEIDPVTSDMDIKVYTVSTVVEIDIPANPFFWYANEDTRSDTWTTPDGTTVTGTGEHVYEIQSALYRITNSGNMALNVSLNGYEQISGELDEIETLLAANTSDELVLNLTGDLSGDAVQPGLGQDLYEAGANSSPYGTYASRLGAGSTFDFSFGGYYYPVSQTLPAVSVTSDYRLEFTFWVNLSRP